MLENGEVLLDPVPIVGGTTQWEIYIYKINSWNTKRKWKSNLSILEFNKYIL